MNCWRYCGPAARRRPGHRARQRRAARRPPVGHQHARPHVQRVRLLQPVGLDQRRHRHAVALGQQRHAVAVARPCAAPPTRAAPSGRGPPSDDRGPGSVFAHSSAPRSRRTARRSRSACRRAPPDTGRCAPPAAARPRRAVPAPAGWRALNSTASVAGPLGSTRTSSPRQRRRQRYRPDARQQQRRERQRGDRRVQRPARQPKRVGAPRDAAARWPSPAPAPSMGHRRRARCGAPPAASSASRVWSSSRSF